MTSDPITQPRSLPPEIVSGSPFKPNLPLRYRLDQVFQGIAWLATATAIAVLIWLVSDILRNGLPTLSWTFLTHFPASDPSQAGVLAALIGTAIIMVLVAVVSFPIGVGSGLYLEEFARDSWFARLLEVNISNLAGVPAILYGLLGLGIFVQLLGHFTGGRSLLSGALTLSLLILPIIIVATREALRAVPDSIRQAGYALGATRWQVIWSHTLPMAFPGILTGVILALSRAIGEAAPLIAIGAVTFITFLPRSLRDPFTVLPIQIYEWVKYPQKEFHQLAASGIIVLLAVLLVMNSLAIFLRYRFQRGR